MTLAAEVRAAAAALQAMAVVWYMRSSLFARFWDAVAVAHGVDASALGTTAGALLGAGEAVIALAAAAAVFSSAALAGLVAVVCQHQLDWVIDECLQRRLHRKP
jgi:hypothetical protein